MDKKLILSGALLGAVALSGCDFSKNGGDAAQVENEKCYGIAKAGKNDCAAEGNNTCAGTATMDRDPKAWIYLPEGACDKIAGGSTESS